LNLFSYTCGFSVYAAAGGASKVVSVDVSQTFLDWGKLNFTLNGLDPNGYEFWCADSLEFVNRTVRRGRTFDIIICDPPSFGRSKRGVFRLEKDLPGLVAELFSILNKNGLLLVSCNFEKWTTDEMRSALARPLLREQFTERPLPGAGLDFLEPGPPILKSLLLEKLT
jgi:23S rRNA (cytosine1962-C5)-methyltransferase